MAKRVHANPKNVHRTIYHHGLIKILIVEELKKRGDNWDAFLSRNRFIAKTGSSKGEPHELVIHVNNNNKNNRERLSSHGAKDFTIPDKTHEKDPLK